MTRSELIDLVPNKPYRMLCCRECILKPKRDCDDNPLNCIDFYIWNKDVIDKLKYESNQLNNDIRKKEDTSMKTNREIISKAVKELGISANLKGYHCIIGGIELILDNNDLMCSIMELYDAIAEKLNTTRSKVERAIRHAIETGWDRANPEFSREMFGYSVDMNRGKPTNSEFMANVADYLIATCNSSERQEL